jgi:acyl-CoA reductase-like NAD-dependent aldehyde dehydrogenase
VTDAAAAALAAGAQPLWAAVPPEARARFLRRAAVALLDELDALADLLAEEAGVPRTEAVLAELLPAIGGLRALAAHGPRALADRRLGPIPALRAGRRSTLVHAPVGLIGIDVRDGSAWAGPLLETAAALLAGNAVLLAPAAPRAAARIRAALVRAGVPAELVAILGDPAALAAADRRVTLDPPAAKGTMLVLTGAPLDRVVPGALWAAFAGGGRRHAAVGRIVVVAPEAAELAARLEAGVRRLRVGDPRAPETEVAPLPAHDARRTEALVAAAEAAGARRLCGGPAPGGYAPVVLRGVAPGDPVVRELVPGPVLPIVEALGDEDAVALARAAAPALVSVWTGDRAHGERVARTLGAELVWINEHGVASPAAPLRLARHTAPRELASQPARLRSARWLPYDPDRVGAATAAARLLHGRQGERWHALRAGAPALARTAIRAFR